MNYSDILIKIDTSPFNKMPLNMPSATMRSFCRGFNVLSLWSVCALNYNGMQQIISMISLIDIKLKVSNIKRP